MRRGAKWGVMALAVAMLVGCESRTDEAGEMSETEERASEETAVTPMAEGDTMDPAQESGAEPTERVAEPGRPGGVAPAEGVEMPQRKNWLLIEFTDSVTQADLAWLDSLGFKVDTVFAPRRVRGVLTDLSAAERLTNDPRIARTDAQMR